MSNHNSFDPLNPVIILTETESKVAKLLTDYAETINGKDPNQESLELRITGGWVRDKLLGNQSNDIDIAINTLTGEEFAEGLAEFIEKSSEVYGITSSGIHKIEKNPEKSKHLETASTKLYGLDIDFVNLRNEEYTEESRVPVVKFGTPEEDALRRDATLNALFYNLSKNKVEDLTKTGLEDLKAGILKTPLQPLKTFLDDPLRVLRLIRFASRFNFTIEENTLNAMKDERIKEALTHKISRERIGVEIEKTLIGPNAIYGLDLIDRIGFFSSVFNFGALQKDVFKFNTEEDKAQATSIFKSLDTNFSSNLVKFQSLELEKSKLNEYVESIDGNKFNKKLFWLTFILSPWESQKYKFNAKKDSFAVELIIKEGLKYSKLDSDSVSKIITKKNDYQGMVNKIWNGNVLRSEVGLLLRNYDSQIFPNSLIFNLLDEHINSTKDDTASIISKYEHFIKYIIEKDLVHVTQLKHLLNGKLICKRFNRKPGPWMSKLLDKILIWQLDNPKLDEEKCWKYLETIIEEFD
ncbi:hypothetical protein WICMUC_000175 [Wickerhamomyces mucosus]|uniref:CCA tRNA nucleotidyltransferase, mitochondrial n=1 Tax=Wickerhamomyces mucosus TaxID=1378264 RepID=A0A9P8PYM3_9ASCO|nr:hypothetical protein WICMUC_000175 [Wickerhamomyces mucosus]